MTTIVNPKIQAYIEAHTQADSALCRFIRETTYQKMDYPDKISGRCTAQLLKLFTHLIQPKLVLDIGMFTGYSALSIAEALPANGQIISCEINPRAVRFAKEIFAKSEVAHKISICELPAMTVIEQINTPIDLVFIDADKKNYVNYYEMLLPKMRPGGLLVIDNVLWGGEVISPQSDRAEVLNALNRYITQDERVENVMLSVDDGLQLVRIK